MPFLVSPSLNAPGAFPLVQFRQDPLTPPANYKIVTGSPKGGSGKTSTMVFAATTLAQMGARILVVEATEGQAPLTQAYHPLSLADDRAGRTGLGAHLFQGLAVGRDESSFEAAYRRYRPAMDREAPTALSELGKIFVTPDKAFSMDFLACGEEALAKVQATPIMQLRHHRRALLTAFLDALAAAHPDGGWDYIFIDTLPAVESTITRAVMGVADSYAVVVDVESAHPLTGWGAINLELQSISEAREAEGKDPNIFRGLILNKIASPSKRALVEKINRYLIACERMRAEQEGLRVDILTEIPRLNLLTLLGFNFAAVETLTRKYGSNFPENLDTLTEDDVDTMFAFKSSADNNGDLLDAAAGVAWLGAAMPGHKARLEAEAQSLTPMLLGLANDNDALNALIQSLTATEA